MTTFADLTTIGVGGPIADLVTGRTDEEIAWALTEDALVLGGGSNLVVADAPFARRVVRIASRGIHVREAADRILVEAAAGEPWEELVSFTVEQGWSGLECLSGIPGLVGATPIQNVGAYGQEVSAVTEQVTVLDRSSGQVEVLGSPDCGFGYRTSRFKQEPDRWVVLRACFALEPVGSGQARYAELAATLGIEPGDRAPVAAIREAVLHLRRAKGMVLDPEDPDTRSVGSFFVNPVLAPAAVVDLADCPRYPAPDGVKLSAAWLIEQAGIPRGWTLPDGGQRVRISTKHTLAIANADGGSAADVLALAEQVRRRVHDRFAIRLDPEPRLVGCRLPD